MRVTILSNTLRNPAALSFSPTIRRAATTVSSQTCTDCHRHQRAHFSCIALRDCLSPNSSEEDLLSVRSRVLCEQSGQAHPNGRVQLSLWQRSGEQRYTSNMVVKLGSGLFFFPYKCSYAHTTFFFV